MKLRTFKPKIPVVLERWGGTHYMFQVGAKDCEAIESTPDGVLVRMAKQVEGRDITDVFLLTGDNVGELAAPDEEDDGIEESLATAATKPKRGKVAA
jgi:hypothetical protein